jgi:hypothetical protein
MTLKLQKIKEFVSNLYVIDRILFTQKLLFAPSILNSRLEFEIPFDLVLIYQPFGIFLKKSNILIAMLFISQLLIKTFLILKNGLLFLMIEEFEANAKTFL